MPNSSKETIWLFGAVGLGLIWSGFRPFDRFTWLLEVLPVLVGVPLLVLTYGAFPLTPLVYRLLTVHAFILLVGGHYTYAHVPAGFWLEDLLGFSRNPYDRIGHLAQGFIPALLVREVFLRCLPLKPGAWLVFLVTATCLGFSALYEIFEWATAVATGEAAEAFLGTQGDVWDTQWDMFLALVGALVGQMLFSRLHDRQLAWVSNQC